MSKPVRNNRSPRPPVLASPIRGAVAILLLIVMVAGAPGCAFYSFTGASVPGHLSTVAVPLAEDNSRSPLATIDEMLTDLLIDRFVGQTRLSLESSESNADAVVMVQINRYDNEPTSVGGDERASLNRVTIGVEVRYIDQVNDEEILERSFSSFEDYDPVELGPGGEEEAALAALDNLADDIFTAATSDW